MKFTATVFASSLLAVSPAAAWGILGHQVVGAVADHYLAPATQTFVANLLNGTLVRSHLRSSPRSMMMLMWPLLTV